MNDRVVGVRGRWQRGAYHAAALLACAGALGLAGCEEDADQRTLTNASIKLSSLSAGAGAPLPDKTAEDGFREVINSVQTLTSGQGAVAADASLLLSAAQRGLGLRAAGRALAAQQGILTRVPGVRAQLEAWQEHNSAARAAESSDFGPEYARIDSDVRARQEAAAAARAEKDRIAKNISELLAQVTAKLSEARALRDQAGALQLQAAGMSATEGLALVEQVRTLSRRADALQLGARDTKAQADGKQVDLHEAEVAIGKLESQIGLLAQSRQAVQTREAASKARAAAARGDAQQAAATIAVLMDSAEGPVPPLIAEVVSANADDLELTPEDLFGDAPAALTPFVDRAFAEAVESAASQLQTATQTARKAQSERRSGAQIATGEAQQSLGDVRWAQAAGLDAYAQVLGELASAQPALPSAAEYAGRAAAAHEASTEAKRAAFDAYQAAKNAYEGSGAKDQVADRIAEVGRKLNGISKVVGAGVMDAEALRGLEQPADEQPDADQPADDMPAGEQPAPGDPEADLRAAIQSVLGSAQAGNYEPAIEFMHPAGDADAAMIEALGGFLRGMSALDKAAGDAFGQSFTAWLGANPDPLLGQFTQIGSAAASFDLDTLDLRVRGDEAIGLTGDPNQPQVRFVRTGGRWKQVVDTEAQKAENPVAAGMIDMMMSTLPLLTQAFAEVTDAVTAGGLGGNPDVAAALKTKMMALMQQMGGG